MFKNPWDLQSEYEQYRVSEDGKLLYTPMNNTNYSSFEQQEFEVEVVTPDQLEQINRILGTHYTIDDINSF
ncbi:MAG: hypothetical protein IE909_03605 [Campylobacterales bacterium]|nr:hypothetical protein [Campylobacterales bacterium]